MIVSLFKVRVVANRLFFVVMTPLVVAGFWWIWSKTATVPLVETFLLPNGCVYRLPHVLSRWSDVFFAPAFVLIFAALCDAYGRAIDANGSTTALCVGLIAAFFGSFSAGVVYGTIYGHGLGIGLLYGHGLGSITGLVIGSVYGIAAALIYITGSLKGWFSKLAVK